MQIQNRKKLLQQLKFATETIYRTLNDPPKLALKYLALKPIANGETYFWTLILDDGTKELMMENLCLKRRLYFLESNTDQVIKNTNEKNEKTDKHWFSLFF